MAFDHIGVIGSGVMGAGIVLAAAEAGMAVTMVDIEQDIVSRGITGIERGLSKRVEKGKLNLEEKKRILKRIEGRTDLESTHDADLIIEAVVEDESVKGELFKSLNGICSYSTVFATNTSTLSVTQLAALSERPDRFIGLHFFNPVYVMKLVEVIPGLRSSKDSVEKGLDLVKKLRKISISVNDCAGFVVNRVLLSYVGEAFLAAQEGAATPEEIDGEARKVGFPMGPLELSDMVGIDISVHTFPVLYQAYGERFPVPAILEKLYKAGRLGLKTKKGIYTSGRVDEEFFGIVEEVKSENDFGKTGFSINRLMLRLVNEAIYCLQEGVATTEDIDRAMVLGTGFPCNEGGVGGPLHWADERGLDRILEEMEELKNTFGQRFWPHYLLKKYVSAGYLGKKSGRGFFSY